MIMIGLFGILSYVLPIPRVSWFDGAVLLILVAAVWYFLVDWRFGFLMTAASAAMWLLARELPLAVNLGLFIGGWIVQFIGHGVYEHKSPAFTKNLTHLLVGPMWILNDLVPLHREEPRTAD